MGCQGSICFSSGAELFYKMAMPESLIHARLGECYEKNPCLSRVVATPLVVLSGIVKFFLLPVICLVGLLVLPIIAIIRACHNQPVGKLLGAWCFCILGLISYGAFLSVTTFHLPLVASAGIFIALLSISITLHVHQFMKEPPVEKAKRPIRPES
jgi:hypothetical protein